MKCRNRPVSGRNRPVPGRNGSVPTVNHQKKRLKPLPGKHLKNQMPLPRKYGRLFMKLA